MTPRRRIPFIVFATAATLTLALSGCTGSTPDPAPTTSAPADAQDPGVTEIEDAPGTGENLVGALADSELATCEKADDVWSVTGSVTNPTDGGVDYRIYVSLLNDGNDTRGLQQVNVSGVEPGASEEWDTTVELSDEDLTCVLRVERYAAG